MNFIPETPPCRQPCPQCGSDDISGLYLAASTPTDLQRSAPSLAGSPLLEYAKENVWWTSALTIVSARVPCLLHHCSWCGYDWLTEAHPTAHPHTRVLKDLYGWLFWDEERGCYDEEREWESASDFIEYAADLLRRINFRPEDSDV